MQPIKFNRAGTIVLKFTSGGDISTIPRFFFEEMEGNISKHYMFLDVFWKNNLSNKLSSVEWDSAQSCILKQFAVFADAKLFTHLNNHIVLYGFAGSSFIGPRDDVHEITATYDGR